MGFEPGVLLEVYGNKLIVILQANESSMSMSYDNGYMCLRDRSVHQFYAPKQNAYFNKITINRYC